jgi:hypothetical protein
VRVTILGIATTRRAWQIGLFRCLTVSRSLKSFKFGFTAETQRTQRRRRVLIQGLRPSAVKWRSQNYVLGSSDDG